MQKKMKVGNKLQNYCARDWESTLVGFLTTDIRITSPKITRKLIHAKITKIMLLLVELSVAMELESFVHVKTHKLPKETEVLEFVLDNTEVTLVSSTKLAMLIANKKMITKTTGKNLEQKSRLEFQHFHNFCSKP